MSPHSLKVPLLKLLFSLLAIASVSQSHSATIRNIYSKHNGNMMSDARIEIVGEIRPGDSIALPSLLRIAVETSRMKAEGRPEFHWMPWLVIDSPGGDVMEAMKIGRLLRDARAAAIITPGASCASACVLVFAGAVERYSYGDRHQTRIGIHRIRPTDSRFITQAPSEAFRAYNQIEREVGLYLEEMGITRALYEQMFSIGSEKIEWLSRDRANDYSLLGRDPAYAEWWRANLINEKGADWVRRYDAYIACLNRNYPRDSVDTCKAETGHERY